MDRLIAIETDLNKAQKELAEFQADLPQFYSLLTDNEADTLRLKNERASLDAQAQARGRVNVATEMLEQHQADIQTARAEVDRLEALKQREQTLAKMVAHSQRTTKHRQALEKAVQGGSEALGRTLGAMLEAFAAIHEERAAFAGLGRELVPGFSSRTPFNNSVQHEQKKAGCEAVLRELEARGATLTDALDSATGVHTPLDTDTRPLPTPEYADLLWKIFDEAVAKHSQHRHLFQGLYLPVQREVTWALPVVAASDDPYQL
jgi:hypothetical protein